MALSLSDWHHHLPLPPPSGGTNAVETVTAVATAAAALIAVWAVISSQRTARLAGIRQRLEKRYDAVVAILSAFERIQEHTRFVDPIAQSDREYGRAMVANAGNVTRKAALAECTALLRASEEALPVTRGLFLNHTGEPVGLEPNAVPTYLASVPLVGTPEVEEESVLRARGEIVRTIDELRAKLCAT